MDCLICFGEASDMTTDCNHSFHQSCLDLWLDAHNTCPYCRFELDIESINENPEQELYDWLESIELNPYVEDSYDSMRFFL